MESWIWAAIGAGLVVVELLTPGYFLIFAAAGAFVVAAAALAGLGALEGQLIVFAAASGLFFALAFRQYRKFLRHETPHLVNSPDRLIGKLGTVEDQVVHGRGKVRVGDSVWLAQGPDLDKGTAIRVAAVDGTVLQVEPSL